MLLKLWKKVRNLFADVVPVKRGARYINLVYRSISVCCSPRNIAAKAGYYKSVRPGCCPLCDCPLFDIVRMDLVSVTRGNTKNWEVLGQVGRGTVIRERGHTHRDPDSGLVECEGALILTNGQAVIPFYRVFRHYRTFNL